MLRMIGGTIAGALTWLIVASVIDRCLRLGWHDYDAVWTAMAFTLPMMIARLTESGISSILGGVVAAIISRERFRAPLLASLILFVPFVYWHLFVLWHKFPIWYHLTFLSSLIILSLLGGRLVKQRRRFR